MAAHAAARMEASPAASLTHALGLPAHGSRAGACDDRRFVSTAGCPHVTSPLAAALSFALLGLSFSADAAPPVAANAPATLRAEAPADARFRAIYEKEWAWRQAETGQADEDTDTTGDNTRLPDVGPAA